MSSFGSDPSGSEWPMIFFGIILGVVLGIPGFLGRTSAHIFRPKPGEPKQTRARFRATSIWSIIFGMALACNPASSFIVDPMQSYLIHPRSSKLNEPTESLRLEVEFFDSETEDEALSRLDSLLIEPRRLRRANASREALSPTTRLNPPFKSDEDQQRLDSPLIELPTTVHLIESLSSSTLQESDEAQPRLDLPLIESPTRTSTAFNPPFQSEIECRFEPTPSKRPLDSSAGLASTALGQTFYSKRTQIKKSDEARDRLDYNRVHGLPLDEPNRQTEKVS